MTETPRNYSRHILIIYVENQIFKHCLHGPAITLGRRKENHIQVLHPAVSGCHLIFSQNANRDYLITDVGSSNGTLVNGRPINQCQLREGDLITIGRMVTAQFLAIPERLNISGDFDSLALVKGRSAPTFEPLCGREVTPGDEQVALPS